MTDTLDTSTPALLLELAHALKRNGFTPAQIKNLSAGNFLTLVREVLEGKKEIQPLLIRVNRVIQRYGGHGEWVQTILHPELELIGPNEYNFAQLERWYHSTKNSGHGIKASSLYEYLKSRDMLKTCLGFQDGEAIIRKGIDAYLRFFPGKKLYLWRSVFRNIKGTINVPYLWDRGHEVLFHYHHIDEDIDSHDPVIRFVG